MVVMEDVTEEGRSAELYVSVPGKCTVFGGGKCPNLGMVNVRILGVVNVLLANDSQSPHHHHHHHQKKEQQTPMFCKDITRNLDNLLTLGYILWGKKTCFSMS